MRLARPAVRSSGSQGECDGQRPGLWVQHLADAHEAAGRQAIGLSGDLDFGGLREASARRLCFGNLTDDVDLCGIHHAEQHAAGGDVRSGCGIALSDHAAHGGADDEQPFGVGGASRACGVVLRQTCLGRRQASLRLLLGGSRLVQRLAGAAPRRQPFGPLAIARRQRERGLCLRARCSCGRSAGAEGGGSSRRVPAPRHAGAKRDSTTRVRRPSMERARRQRRQVSLRGARNANRFSNRLFLHERGPEVQAPLLFLQEADAWRILACGWRGGTGGFSVRMHVDFADTMFIASVPWP